jgi:hypothetical protein
MKVNEIENDPELQQILWACYKYWQGEPSPPHKRSICYSWVVSVYEDRFGDKFHQSKLRRLESLGFMQQGDTSRGGSRRYYRLVDPNRVAELLEKWALI